MIKCMPILTTAPEGNLKIAFDVHLVDVDANIDNIHTEYDAYGGGTCFKGKEIGRASVVLKRGARLDTKNELNVLFLSGYRTDGKNFCVETQKSVIEACKKAARAFWG